MAASTAQPPKLHPWFFPLTLAYLVLPALIFLTTWVRPWLGLPAAAVVLFCAAWLVRQQPPPVTPGSEPRAGLGRRDLMFVLALAFFWTLLAGAGGFVPQVSDYLRNNLLYHDLVHLAWPVTYPQPDGHNSYLCYGLGFFLPPALGGRLLGDAAMPALTFLWMFAGVALFFYWVAAFTRSPKTTLVIFLLFAATNIGLLALKRAGIPGWLDYIAVQNTLRELGLYHSYYDFFTKLQYQPQHGMPGLLGLALFYEMLWIKKDPRGAVFVWGACLFWSPIPCIGLLLIPLAAIRRVPWRAYFSGINLVGGGSLLAILGVYYQGHLALEDHGFLWNFAPGGKWLIFYLLFVALELSPVLVLFLIDRKYRMLGEWRPLFLLAAGLLVLLPLWKFGHSGDQRLQAGTPALVVAALCAVRCLQSDAFSLKRPLFLLFIGCLLIGAAYPLGRPWWNLITNHYDYSYAATVRTFGFQTLAEMKEPLPPRGDNPALNPGRTAAAAGDTRLATGYLNAEQYLGRPDSAAARWLLR